MLKRRLSGWPGALHLVASAAVWADPYGDSNALFKSAGESAEFYGRRAAPCIRPR